MEIVKGNDISISWRIYRIVDGVKVPENLTTAIDFQTLVTANGLNVPITNSTISDTNLITILIKGRDQITGIYALEASWTSSLGEDSRVAYGKAFTVVDKQCQADYTLPEGLDVVSLEFYSSTHFGALYENLDVQKDPTKESVLGELHNNVLTYDSSINKWCGKPVKNYDRLDAWSDYSVGKEGWVLSAKLGKQLYDTKLNISAISEWALQPTFPGYTKEEIDAMIDSGGGSGDTFWELHPTEPNTIYTTYNVVSAGEISAYGVGSGGGGTVGALSELSDVQLTSLLSGDLLRYNGSHWINVPQTSVGTQVSWGGISSGYRQLSVAGTSYGLATDAHNHSISQVDGLQSALDNKWTTDSDKIANWDTAYTARHSHNNKDVLDQLNQNNVNVLSKLFLDNDGNLYTTENFYSEREISAYGYGGSGGGSGGAGALYELSDTSVDSRVTGDILIYNGTHWENRPQSSIVPDLTGYATEAWANNRFSLIGHTHNYIPLSQKGVANGVAELDATGHIPSSQLPSYVDDVLEFATTTNFPTTGETGKIYIALNTNLTYRWSGSGYVEISPSLALGETSSTAYRGDRGKIAYDHSQATGNPHNTTFAQLGSKPTTLSGYGITDAVTSTVFNDHKNNVNSEKHLTQAQLTNLINLSNWWKWDETNQAVYTEENVYSEKEISAYGAGSGGGGGAGALSELSDVNLTNPINTNLLQYNGSHWVNVPASSVGTPVSWGTTSNNTSPLTVSGVTKTVSLSGHLHAGVYEPVFTKNTAFNKNFGTTAGTVAEGNHTHTFASLTSKPTTLAGYGITDAHTKTEVGTALSLKLNKSVFDDLFEKVEVSTGVFAIKANYSFYSTGEVSAYGIGSGGSGGGSYDRLDAWADYDSTKSGWVLSALLGVDLNTRLSNIEGGSALTVNTTGTGNAITSISKAGTVITATKGATFSLDGHIHNLLRVADTRDIVSVPQDLINCSLQVDFKSNGSVGYPSITAHASYSHIISFAGWNTGEPSGGWPSQLSIGDGIAVRQATSATTWGEWRNLYHTGNLVNPITGTGTVNYIPKFTAVGSIGNSSIYDNGTNVGIGTTSPSYKLDVAGTGRFTGNVIAPNFIGALSGNASTATNAANADLLGGYPITSLSGKGTYHYTNGILVTTSIPDVTDMMIYGRITGNSYSDNAPIDTIFQFYNYTGGNSIIQATALNNGFNISEIKVFNYSGYICIWLPCESIWQSYNIEVFKGMGYLKVDVTSKVENVVMPSTGVTRLVTITPRQSAFITSNVASATKLQTARTITVGNTGKSFDGSGNVSWSLAEIGALPLTGGTLTGILNSVGLTYGKAIPKSGVDANTLTTAGFYDGSGMINMPNSGWFYLHVQTYSENVIWVQQTAISFGSSNTANRRYSRVNVGGTWTAWSEMAYLTDNVASATKLQTARTIWGQSFDGTGNVAGDLSGVWSVLPAATNYYSIGSQTNEFGNSYIRGMYTRHLDGTTSGGMDGDLYINYGKSNNSTGRTFILGGNVGLGTINPTAKLNIVHTANSATPALRVESSGSLANNDIARLQINGLTNGFRMFQDANSNVVYSFEGGNVGIGTSTPVGKLQITGGWLDVDRDNGGVRFTSGQATRSIIYSNSSNDIRFSSPSSPNLFTALDNGNVGIGTTSPIGKLHIKGESLIVDNSSLVPPYIKLRGNYDTDVNWDGVIVADYYGGRYNANVFHGMSFIGGRSGTDNYRWFDSSYWELMTLHYTGNLSLGRGVNPSDSGYKLDVNGTGRFTGALTAAVSVTTPKVIFAAAGWSLEQVGTELQMKHNGVVKQRMLSDGSIVATGEITAFVSTT